MRHPRVDRRVNPPGEPKQVDALECSEPTELGLSNSDRVLVVQIHLRP